MPCLIITGHPSAGKTTVAKLLRDRALLHKAIDEVVLLNEESECGCCSDVVSENGGNNIRHNGNVVISSKMVGIGGPIFTENDVQNDEGGSVITNPARDNGETTQTTTKSPTPTTTTSASTVSITKQHCYGTAASEKQTRSALKSAFDRAVGRSTSGGTGGGGSGDNDKTGTRPRRCRLVILDSLNYIKGFRYELHCISKAAGEQHGVLWVLNKVSVVQEWNEARGDGYSPDLLEELISRYEPPDERNRWDRPLFTVDVAPTSAINSIGTTDSNQDESNDAVSFSTITKTEVLEKSVYNMHSLADTMGSSDDKGGTKSATSKSTLPRASQVVKPKKSAFQRKIDPSVTNSRTGSGPSIASALTTANLASLNEIYNDSVSSVSVGQQLSGNTNLTPTRVLSATFQTTAAEQQTTTKTKASVVSGTQAVRKSLEEQLDEILDIFLLQTKALKEGTSTRQNMAGQANVLQNLDSISAKVIAAIATAQNTHTGGCNLQIPLPALTQNDNDNAIKGPSPMVKYLSMKCPRYVGLPELRRLRKMFLQWAAIHPPEDTSEIGIATSFVRYVEDKL